MLLSPQAVPGPGQYDVKSQFERPPSSVEDDMELEEVVTQKAPFGSGVQVILSFKITPFFIFETCLHY